jgi:hypothetical protein
MSTIQSLEQQIASLPQAAKEELTHFLRVITDKYSDEKSEHETMQQWSAFSLSSAMRDIEEEETPYTIADITEMSGTTITKIADGVERISLGL